MTTPAKALADLLQSKYAKGEISINQVAKEACDFLRSLPDTPRGREEMARIAAAFQKVVRVMKAARNDSAHGSLMSVWPDDMKAAEDVMAYFDAILALPPATPRPVEIEDVTAGREGVQEMRAALERAQDVLRRYMRHEHDGTVRSSANAVLHEIKHALELPAQDTADRTGADAITRELAALREWKASVLSKCKHCDGFDILQWSGDKEGWGFVHYFIGHLNTRALERTTAARTERRGKYVAGSPFEQDVRGPDVALRTVYPIREYGIGTVRVIALASTPEVQAQIVAALSLHDGEKG